MKLVSVDANVFLRFFTKDDARQHACAAQLFRTAAKGEIALMVGPPVLFEVAWTLRSAYNQTPSQVADVLEAVLSLPGLTITDASICTKALRLARDSGVEFPDAYIAALAETYGADAVATFNLADFQRLGTHCHTL